MKLMTAFSIAAAAIGVLMLANCSSGSGGGSSSSNTCYTQNGITYGSGTVVQSSNCGGGTYISNGSACYNSSYQPAASTFCGGSANGYSSNGYYGGTGYGNTGYGYGGSTGYTCPYYGQRLVVINGAYYCTN